MPLQNLKLFHICLLGLFIRLLTSYWIGGGFYHPDAHWQYFEPAFFHTNGFGALPWEFDPKFGVGARSWFFPGIIYGFLHVFKWIHLNDPMIQVFIFRTLLSLSSVLGIYCIYEITKILANESAAKIAALYAALWGFFVYFNIQFHGEMMAIPWMLLAHLHVLKASQKKYAFLSGLALGLVFLFKFHVAAFGFSLLGYLLLKRRWLGGFLFCLGVAIMLFVQGMIDTFTWGEFFSTFFNYTKAVTSDHLSKKPFTAYFEYLVKILSPILLPAILFYLYYAAKKINLIWASIFVYFVIHSFVNLKALRYISPIVPFFFILVALGIDRFQASSTFQPKYKKLILKFSIILFIVAGSIQYLAPFVPNVLKPTRPPWLKRTDLAQATYFVGKQKESTGVLYVNHDPIGYFYLNKNIPIGTAGHDAPTIQKHLQDPKYNFMIFELHEPLKQELLPTLNQSWDFQHKVGDYEIYRKRTE